MLKKLSIALLIVLPVMLTACGGDQRSPNQRPNTFQHR